MTTSLTFMTRYIYLASTLILAALLGACGTDTGSGDRSGSTSSLQTRGVTITTSTGVLVNEPIG